MRDLGTAARDGRSGTLARAAAVGDLAYALYDLVPLGVMAALARRQGGRMARRAGGRAEAVRENLVTSFPDVPPEELDRLVVRFFEDQQVRRLLTVLAPRMDRAAFHRVATLEGGEHLERVRAAGTGGILLLSHLHSLGGFLGVMRLRRDGYDVRVALPTMRDPWTATRFRGLLSRILGARAGVPELIGGFYCQFNIRPIVRALGEGAIVAQTGDGWHSASFVDVSFLGRCVPFPTGIMSVARTMGVPVVPAFCLGRPPYLRFRLEAPFTVPRAAGGLEDRVQAWAAMLERHVRDHPWAWEHWGIPNALDTLEGMQREALAEKYVVG